MTRARTWRILLAAALGAVVALALVPEAPAELGPDALPSEVIFPKQKLPLSFSHARHLGEVGLGCVDCHVDAATSTRAADNNMPAEKVCSVAGCHAIDRAQPDKEVPDGQPDARCGSCHVGWNGTTSSGPPRLVVPSPNLKFNHKTHTDRGVSCVTCHGDLVKAGVNIATRAQLPRMSLCLGCHNGKTAPDACTTCHLGKADGRLETMLGQQKLVPSGALYGDAHDERFRTEHADVAKDKAAYCASCHTKQFCGGCHDSVEKPMDFHAGDYVTLHPIDARRQKNDCGACHRLQTFCQGCHDREGVSDNPKTSEFQRPSKVPEGTNRYHPDGWLSSGRRTRSDHSFEAQRNLRTCASCHREEFCMECHGASGTGGARVNPHPAGWRQSRRCATLAARAGRMCLKCHLDLEGARCE